MRPRALTGIGLIVMGLLAVLALGSIPDCTYDVDNNHYSTVAMNRNGSGVAHNYIQALNWNDANSNLKYIINVCGYVYYSLPVGTGTDVLDCPSGSAVCATHRLSPAYFPDVLVYSAGLLETQKFLPHPDGPDRGFQLLFTEGELCTNDPHNTTRHSTRLVFTCVPAPLNCPTRSTCPRRSDSLCIQCTDAGPRTEIADDPDVPCQRVIHFASPDACPRVPASPQTPEEPSAGGSGGSLGQVALLGTVIAGVVAVGLVCAFGTGAIVRRRSIARATTTQAHGYAEITGDMDMHEYISEGSGDVLSGGSFSPRPLVGEDRQGEFA